MANLILNNQVFKHKVLAYIATGIPPHRAYESAGSSRQAYYKHKQNSEKYFDTGKKSLKKFHDWIIQINETIEATSARAIEVILETAFQGEQTYSQQIIYDFDPETQKFVPVRKIENITKKNNSWQSAKWFLERTRPDIYGNKAKSQQKEQILLDMEDNQPQCGGIVVVPEMKDVDEWEQSVKEYREHLEQDPTYMEPPVTVSTPNSKKDITDKAEERKIEAKSKGKIPTIKVVHKPTNQLMTINEADFNPDIHEVR